MGRGHRKQASVGQVSESEGVSFHLLGNSSQGARIYTAQGQTPQELVAIIGAIRTISQRVIVVFQPRLFSHTSKYAREIGRVLSSANEVVVLDIDAASERAEEYPGISGLKVAEAATDYMNGRSVYWLPAIADAEIGLNTILSAGDGCILIGEGDLDTLSNGLVVADEDKDEE